MVSSTCMSVVHWPACQVLSWCAAPLLSRCHDNDCNATPPCSARPEVYVWSRWRAFWRTGCALWSQFFVARDSSTWQVCSEHRNTSELWRNMIRCVLENRQQGGSAHAAKRTARMLQKHRQHLWIYVNAVTLRQMLKSVLCFTCNRTRL
jgi:hypothetical protein